MIRVNKVFCIYLIKDYFIIQNIPFEILEKKCAQNTSDKLWSNNEHWRETEDHITSFMDWVHCFV